MPFSLASNTDSLVAQRNLKQATEGVSSAFQRLSSGLRINTPSDDPAGLGVADILKANFNIYSKAIQNVNDGISYLSIAETAAYELKQILTRIKELAQQAANGAFRSPHSHPIWLREIRTAKATSSYMIVRPDRLHALVWTALGQKETV